ncbi:hypothetical protein [Kribbella swartbergensis]
MADTRTLRRTGAGGPAYGTLTARLLRSIWYDVRLVWLGAQTMADAVTGQERTAEARWEVLARSQRLDRAKARRAKVGREAGVVFGHGVVSSGLGVVSWFLVGLLVMAVVRGPLYGVVEHGPVGAGTWGGPTKAGAWAVHAAVSVPIVLGLLFGLRGIQVLHEALVRRLYGMAGPWVLPATITVCGGGLVLMWSWIQQL